MSARDVVAMTATIVLASIAALHLAWAIAPRASTGAPLTVPEAHGRPLFQPSRAATLAVAIALSIAASVVAMRVRVFVIGLAVVFLARAIGEFRYIGFFKRVRGTRFSRWDSWLYSPLCLALAGACGVVAS